MTTNEQKNNQQKEFVFLKSIHTLQTGGAIQTLMRETRALREAQERLQRELLSSKQKAAEKPAAVVLQTPEPVVKVQPEPVKVSTAKTEPKVAEEPKVTLPSDAHIFKEQFAKPQAKPKAAAQPAPAPRASNGLRPNTYQNPNAPSGGYAGGNQGQYNRPTSPNYQGNRPNPNYQSNRPVSPNYQGSNPNPNYQGNRPNPNYQGSNPNPNYQGSRPNPNYQGSRPNSNYQGNRPNSNYQGSNPNPNYQGQRPYGPSTGPRPPYTPGQKPYNNSFVASKGNMFKSFAPTEKAEVLATPERQYGNKNKNPVRQYDDKKQFNKRALIRKGYVVDETLGSIDGERMGSRKLLKNKKRDQQVFVAPAVENAIITTELVSVKELSEKTGKPVAEIIKQLIVLGIMATINSNIDFATAELVASELGITLEQKLEQSYEDKLINFSNVAEEDEKDTISRPPIVTVMGHVDHGKTSLLDAIRNTTVVTGEAGGITQHIGAYSITHNGKMITFIDTPGHAAFSAMRARGAKVTDVAILVVAADDGIMPQTIEAINHIKAANVPMIVAINKMDKQEANPERIKQQLADNNVLPEEWGGDAILVPISAHTGMGLDKLLEMILLVAEMQNPTATVNRLATGTIIEAQLDKTRGPIATILVQNGTLRVGDTILSGITVGKIKAMFNDKGVSVKSAGPSLPVAVLGLSEVPNAGDQVYAVDEKLSKAVIEERKSKIKTERSKTTSGVSLEDFMTKVNEGKLKNLNIIIKADVQGSVEVLMQSLGKIHNDEVRVNCLHSGAGQVTESDVLLAEASQATIISFNMKVPAKVASLADSHGVQISEYKVIYVAVDEITSKIKSMLTVKYEDVIIGHAEIRAVFKLSSNGTIAGSMVKDGVIKRHAKARLIRDGEIIHEGEIDTLKIMKDDKTEVATGYECGIRLGSFSGFKVGDIIEAYNKVAIKN